MHTESTSVALSLVTTIRRRWPTVLVTAVVLASGGLSLIWNRPRTYTSTAMLLVQSDRREGDVTVDIQTLQIIERRGETISQIALQQSALSLVKEITSLPYTEEQLRGRLTVSPLPRTELIRVTATDTVPAQAQLIANAAAQAVIQQWETIEQQRPSGTSLSIAERATLPSVPTSTPRRVQVMGVGLFSLFAAVIIGRLREHLDRRIVSEEDVEKMLHTPIIGKTFRFRTGTTNILRSRDAFRDLQSSIQFLPRVPPERVIAITGGSISEGKSTTTANLALAFHDVDQEVIALDLDFRRPTLHRLFRVEPPEGYGVAQILQSTLPFPAPLQTAYAHIRFYPAGNLPLQEATRAYQSPRLPEFIEFLQGKDGATTPWILMDLPPLLSVPGSVAAASVARNALYVLELGRARMRDAEESFELIRRAHVNLLGVVFTKLPRPQYRSEAYYYGVSEPLPAGVKKSR